MKRRVAIFVILSLAVATVTIPVVAVAAPAPQNLSIYIASTTGATTDYGYLNQYFYDGSQATLSEASVADGIDVDGPGLVAQFILQPSVDGPPIHSGRYTNLDSDSSSQVLPHADSRAGNEGFFLNGDVDILDLATAADGTYTRFDVVFRSEANSVGLSYFGEVRYNEPQAAPVRLGYQDLEWPLTPKSNVPISAPEVLHNTSTAPATIGKAELTGFSATQYRLGSDGCSNRVLAAGASCKIGVSYTPKVGGPSGASLAVPVNGKAQVARLEGEALKGATSVTLSGNDTVSQKSKHSLLESNTDLVATGSKSVFDLQSSYEAYEESTSNDIDAHFDSGSGLGPLQLGVHTTGSVIGGAGTALYGEGTSFDHSSCNTQSGNEDIVNYSLDRTGTPDMARIYVTQHCNELPANETDSVEIQYQYRTDTTPPDRVSNLVVSSGKSRVASWTPSKSGVRDTIARLVEGDGASALPTSGYALSEGPSASANLPALIPGVQYTVDVFTVDPTGNVSAPLSVSITG